MRVAEYGFIIEPLLRTLRFSSRLLFNPFSLAFLSYSVCRSFLLLPPSQEKDVFHVFLMENLESADRPLAFKTALISQLINLRIADFKA